MPYTMAHHFKKAEYDTAALGKMHFIPDTETSRGNERNWGFDVRTDYEEYWHYLVDEQGCVPSQELDKAPRDIAHLEMQQHVLQTQLVKPDASVQPNAKVAEDGTLPMKHIRKHSYSEIGKNICKTKRNSIKQVLKIPLLFLHL